MFFQVKSTFSINISTNFYSQSMIELGKYATITTQRKDGGNMVNSTLWTELSALLNYVTSTTITDGGTTYSYTDLCAKQNSVCVIDGGYIFSTTFITALGTNSISSPVFSDFRYTAHYQKYFWRCNICGRSVDISSWHKTNISSICNEHEPSVEIGRCISWADENILEQHIHGCLRTFCKSWQRAECQYLLWYHVLFCYVYVDDNVCWICINGR